jgi:hypothetical protein
MSSRPPVWAACIGARKAQGETRRRRYPWQDLDLPVSPTLPWRRLSLLSCRHVHGRDSWRARHGGPAAEMAAHVIADSARLEPVLVRAEASSAAAADRAVPTADAARAARPKPVPPALTYEQREAARLKALQMTAERKRLRARLQAAK